MRPSVNKPPAYGRGPSSIHTPRASNAKKAVESCAANTGKPPNAGKHAGKHAGLKDDNKWMISTWMTNRGGLGSRPWAEDMTNTMAFAKMKPSLTNE